MKTTEISRSKTHLFSLPVPVKRSDAIQAFTAMELLVVELWTSEGLNGVGYGYTIGTGGRAAKTYLDTELIPLLAGEDCESHEFIWGKMAAATRASSGGPISSIARAAVDIAVWDIKAKAHGVPLYKLLGGSRDRVPAYDTEGGWLHIPLEELVSNARQAVEKGFHGIKIKVGREDATEDVARLQAVRSVVGPTVKLMVDANQGWRPSEAIRRARLFEPFDLYWLEEPIVATDVSGHRELKMHISIPIAVGETLYSKESFAEYVHSDAAGILQPDVARVGGITEWMKVAAMAEAFQMSVAPHFLMEIQLHLAAATPNGIFVEYIPQLAPYLEEEFRLEDGCLVVPERPGHGILFAWDKLEACRL
jgi:L-alanine-DL-glutamate epimerase-like enolase superfamily enzyme